VGWSRREAVGLALFAGVGGLAGCDDRAAAPQRENDDGFPMPEQTAGLFEEGSRHQLSVGDWATATTRSAGMLCMPTGRLIAADPSWLPSSQRLHIGPYTVTVPAGSYPVSLAVVSWPGDRRVAAARLTVRNELVHRWEMALLPGQDLAALGPGEAYNVGVDSATMAFLDAAGLSTMARQVDDAPEAFQLTAEDQPLKVPGTGASGNLIAFGTGYGDGGYPVWIGRTTTGAVGCFMADMAMLRRQQPTATPSR
jgi:Protein of unknown function (DUF4241)